MNKNITAPPVGTYQPQRARGALRGGRVEDVFGLKNNAASATSAVQTSPAPENGTCVPGEVARHIEQLQRERDEARARFAEADGRAARWRSVYEEQAKLTKTATDELEHIRTTLTDRLNQADRHWEKLYGEYVELLGRNNNLTDALKAEGARARELEAAAEKANAVATEALKQRDEARAVSETDSDSGDGMEPEDRLAALAMRCIAACETGEEAKAIAIERVYRSCLRPDQSTWLDRMREAEPAAAGAEYRHPDAPTNEGYALRQVWDDGCRYIASFQTDHNALRLRYTRVPQQAHLIRDPVVAALLVEVLGRMKHTNTAGGNPGGLHVVHVEASGDDGDATVFSATMPTITFAGDPLNDPAFERRNREALAKAKAEVAAAEGA